MRKTTIIPFLCCLAFMASSPSSAAPKEEQTAKTVQLPATSSSAEPSLLEADKSTIRRFFLDNARYVLEAGKLAAQREQAVKIGERMLQNTLPAPVPASPTVLYVGQEPAILFTDFFCGNCRGYAELLHETFPDMEISLRFLPSNEGAPTILARWALAAYERDRELFFGFHSLIEENIQMLANSESIEDFQKKVEDMAGKAGYDARILRQMLTEKSDAYDARLKEDIELAKKAGIMATPGMVWGEGRYQLIGRHTPDMLRFLHGLLTKKDAANISFEDVEKAFPAE